ncbi:MAG TPA: RNA polymerase sigma factor [Phycisphaerales bacterium]|nr:RNA polymerase sigma factor [Phycisphaerales bacterium]
MQLIPHYIVRIRILYRFFEVLMSQTNKYYIERCLDGHSDDFRYLVRRYQTVLLAQLTGRLGSKDKADEAAQESFVRAYFSLEKLKKPDSFFPWLLGIAKRVAKEHQRNEQRRRREIVRSFSEKVPGPELSQDYALERAIAELPDSYRKLILLRYYGGYSCSQVAEQFDIPLGTVTKKLSRAYTLLRKSLRQQKRNENCEVQK